MRILLDESVPRQLAPLLTGHQVSTVPQQGWAGIKNGDLVRRAEGCFDVFITGDRNLQYQQNLTGVEIGIVVLAAVTTRLNDLLPLIPAALQAIETIRPGEVVRVAA